MEWHDTIAPMNAPVPLNDDPIEALVARGLAQLRASAPQSAELLADAEDNVNSIIDYIEA